MDIKDKDLKRNIIGYGTTKIGTILINDVKAFYDDLSKKYYIVPIASSRKFGGVQYACIYGKKNVDYFERKTFKSTKKKIESILN